MSKGLRLSEKWFHRGLWVVALVFANFLIGLGSIVVSDLPKVEAILTLDNFMDRAQADSARAAIQVAERSERDALEALEQSQLKLKIAQADYTAARESFANWVATRRATEQSAQNDELTARTQALDKLKVAERQTLAQIQAQEQIVLNAKQAAAKAEMDLRQLQALAQIDLEQAQSSQELRVFLYRLALTLPLLGVAGWLFAKKRKSTYWPFVWGFIIFALVAFFVELVPYLPSYGGYVRYLAGVVITVVVGRQAITALNRYLENQKLAEQKPDALRRVELSYDTALARLAKNVCPGCERQSDLKDKDIDFCPHCGICLFNRCGHCQTRKNTFLKFCHTCGTHAAAEVVPQ